ncbi:MAG: tetratricopeptide repeat protein [Lentisphaeria bacterium]|nr:tetratricopeptide repeat protein [Lentisphaeria bacterium]
MTGFLLGGAAVANDGDAASAQRLINLSRIAVDEGHLADAFEMLNRARRNAAPEVWRECTRKMMSLALRLGNTGDAKRLLTEFQKAYPDMDTAWCRFISGRIAFAEGRLPEAVKILSSAVGDAALSRDDVVIAWQTMVRANLSMKQYAEAEAIAAKLQNTADTEAERFWGCSRRIFARIMGENPASAGEFFQKRPKTVLESDKHQLDKLELLYWLRTGDFDRFQQAYDRVSAGSSSDSPDELFFQVNRAAGEYLQNHGRAREGEAYFRKAVSFAPGEALQRRTSIQYIDCCIAAEDYAVAAQAIRNYLNRYSDDPKALDLRFNMARLRTKGGQPAEAIKDLHDILADPDIPRAARFAAGREAVDVAVAAKDAAWERNALERLSQFCRDKEERAVVAMLSGHCEYRAGQFAAAAGQFAAAAEGKDSETARFWQLQSLIKAKDFAAALPVAEALRQAKSEEVRGAAAFYHAEALENTGKSAGAIAGYLAFMEAFPRSLFRPTAAYRAASLLSGEKKFGQSQQLFAAFAAEYPEHELAPSALLEMQNAAFLNGDEKGMRQAVERLQQGYPASTCTGTALFRMVDYYRSQGRAGEALKVIDDIESISGGDEAQLAQCLYDRAVILEKEDPSASCRLLEELAQKYPKADILAEAMLFWGNILSNLGDYGAAAERYGKAAELRPEGRFNEICRERRADSLINEAARNGSSEMLTAAADEFARLAESPDPAVWGAAVFKQGRAMELAGNTRSALTYYKEVLYRAVAAVEKGQLFDRLWCSKALYAAVRINAGRRTVSAAREALQLIALARDLKLETDANEYSRLEEELRNRIRF